MNIYDLYFNDVPVAVYHEDGCTKYEREDFYVRAVAETRGQAHALAIRFIVHVHPYDRPSIDFMTPVSIRKIAPAWNGARPHADWPMMFEYRCVTAVEAEYA